MFYILEYHTKYKIYPNDVADRYLVCCGEQYQIIVNKFRICFQKAHVGMMYSDVNIM